MISWVARKVMNSRVSNCIFEVGSGVSAASGKERALFHIYSVFWAKEFQDAGLPMDLLDGVGVISAAEAEYVYSRIEAARNAIRFGNTPWKQDIEFLETMANRKTDLIYNFTRGMELLMIAFAVRMLPKKAAAVSNIWRDIVDVTEEDRQKAIMTVRDIDQMATIYSVLSLDFGRWTDGTLRGWLDRSPDFIRHVQPGAN